MSLKLKGRKFSEEHIQKLRIPHPSIKGENNPSKRLDVRKKLSVMNNPSKRPEVREKISVKLKGRTFSEETKKKMSETRKMLYAEGKLTSHLKGKKMPEQQKKNLSEAKKKLFKEGILKPYWRGKHFSNSHKSNISKVRKQLYAEGKIINWFKGKKFSEEHIKNLVLSFKRRPTSYEKELEKTLNKIQPNEWKYTGDGSFLIGYKNPDFVNVNGKKQVIEVYHNYFKIKGFGSEENYKKQRAEHFAKYGYETIFLNGDEYDKEEIVREKLWRLEWS